MSSPERQSNATQAAPPKTVQAPGPASPVTPRRSKYRQLVEFVLLLLGAFALRSFVAEPYEIPTGSMLPTVQIGDRVVITKLAYGARISLLVGVTSTMGAIGIGVLLGAIAGYYGGVVDDLLMRFTEFFQIIPTFVLLMVLVAFMQPSLGSAVIGIALISWPQVARVVRGEFLSLREREFVQAARVLGVPIGTVRSRLSRGRERLRHYVNGDVNGDQRRRNAELRRVK